MGLSSDSLGTHTQQVVSIFPRIQEQRVSGRSALIHVARTGGNNQRADRIQHILHAPRMNKQYSKISHHIEKQG